MDNYDNLEEYNDPILYDLENSGFEPDGPFFLHLAQQAGGPVLELGCGTGRLTIPLAKQEIDITGLDVMPTMLKRAKEKAHPLAIEWVEADARTFQLERQFHLIFGSRMFQHFPDRSDQEAVLQRVREHLTPNGLFAFSLPFPHLVQLTDELLQAWYTYVDDKGLEVQVSGTSQYDPVRQIKIETAYRRWVGADGQEVVKAIPLMLRYFFPQEMETLLHYNGFTVSACYGSWDLKPLTSESMVMLYVCQKT